ncbi:MAG: DUF5305 domain-containing protein [Firmicutes bacterium]|nr:DUF5305 domain-containing protein [Bacillota bacterium]
MGNKKGNLKQILENKIIRVFLVVIAILLLFFSLKIGIDSLSWKSTRNDNVLYSYNMKKGYTYGVNLMPNEYIDKNPQGMNELYISKLINNFDIMMTYAYSASSALDLTYEYEITSSIVGEYKNSADGESAEVWVKNFPILNKVTKQQKNTSQFNIQEKFTVDYQYYNNYVKDFMKKMGLTIDAYLKVQMRVITVGNLKDNLNSLHEDQTVVMKIPLNQEVFAISGEPTKDTSKHISGIQTYVEKVNPGKMVLGIVMFSISVLILGYILHSLFKKVKKDEYQTQKDKILKEYGDIIVETNSPVRMENYQVIEVKNFNEMIDLEEELHIPILYFEPAMNQISWFIIIHDNILYRYVLKLKEDE